ncbi:hypothetical protein RGQ13_07550 [Thalassotalea psychrophila]|uniref:Outer membrane protein beta-barrel domain-containing protein n=1 Tax=Thalassotalea psychrophila TaxID=3065647 RepID=A0ABY9U280_9GAMM|nr:hypothetical protein RGQ13_07550 [Colwelliaceae bacterium SQ149]
MIKMSKAMLTAIALSTPFTAYAEDWKFEFTPYIWAAANEGKSGAYGDLNGVPFESISPIDISFSDLAEELDFGTMFNFSAKKNNWFMYSEVTVLSIENAEVAVPPPADASSASIKTDISGEIIDIAAGYRLMERSNFDLYGYIGARYFNLDVTLKTKRTKLNNEVVKRNINTGDDFIDPFVGVHAKWKINNTFALQGRLEVGGFADQPSENTLVSVTLDHNLSDNWSLKYFYRMMNIDYKDNGFVYDMEVTGPGIGATYKF